MTSMKDMDGTPEMHARFQPIIMTRWFFAVCQDCTPVLPQPFSDPGERDEWAAAHRQGTGHAVIVQEVTGA